MSFTTELILLYHFRPERKNKTKKPLKCFSKTAIRHSRVLGDYFTVKYTNNLRKNISLFNQT